MKITKRERDWLVSKGWHLVTRRQYRSTFVTVDVWCRGNLRGSYSALDAYKMQKQIEEGTHEIKNYALIGTTHKPPEKA